MGKITINFADVEGGFEPVPEGTYPAIVEKVEVRESKSSDHNYLNWEFKISDGEHEGQRLWQITSLSPKALFRLKDQFEALDVLDDEMELEWDDDVEITPTEGPLLVEPDCVGMEVLVVVKNEMYEGKERNRVEEVRSADTAPARSERSSNKSGSKTRRRAMR